MTQILLFLLLAVVLTLVIGVLSASLVMLTRMQRRLRADARRDAACRPMFEGDDA